MDSSAAKYGFWGVVVAAVITGAVYLYIHFDSDSKSKEQEIEDKRKLELEELESLASLTISDVYVPPVNTSLDSAFFARIDNNYVNVAEDVRVTLNFGEAEMSRCETLPNDQVPETELYSNSVFEFYVGRIEPKASFYVYCLISSPVFESILVSGSNLRSNERYFFSQFSEKENEDRSGYEKFFAAVFAVAGFFIVVSGTILIVRLLLGMATL